MLKKLIFIILVLFVLTWWFTESPIKTKKANIPTVTVEEIKTTQNYNNKMIKIIGKSKNTISIGLKFYTLNSKTGNIYVKCENNLPNENSLYEITGIVKKPIKLFGLKVRYVKEISRKQLANFQTSSKN